MKKQMLFAMVILSFAACAKKANKNPMARPNPAIDSSKEADSKKAAQKDSEPEETKDSNGAKEDPAPDKKKNLKAPESNSETVIAPQEAEPESPTESKLEESDTPRSPESKAVATAGFKFDRSYFGDALTLIHPSENKNLWGEIHFAGADAQKLYETLQIKELSTDENQAWQPGKKKHGYHVSCYQQESKETPGLIQHDCTLFLQFESGALVPKVSKTLTDHTVPELKVSYTGLMLKLMTPHPHKLALLQLQGKDAEALYTVMKVEVKTEPASNPDYSPSGSFRPFA